MGHRRLPTADCRPVIRGCLALIVGMAIAVASGCSKPEEETKIQNPEPKTVAVQPAPAAARPALEQPPPRPTIPKVSLSKDLLATCRVQVGDKMPVGELRDVDGKPQSLQKLFGKKLTVVFFWIAESPYSMGEVEDQNDDVVKDYAAKGVQVIGINQGESPRGPERNPREVSGIVGRQRGLLQEGGHRKNVADVPSRRPGKNPLVRHRVFSRHAARPVASDRCGFGQAVGHASA